VPVNGKCAMHAWTAYQHRAATPDEIERWWTSCSTAGIAIVTGHISQVVALDVDGRLGAATLARLEAEHGRLPETAVQRTGRDGGRHRVFRHPGRLVKTLNHIAPGLDRKGDGGYFVAAPSLHESGRRYEWIEPLPRDIEQLPPMPDWLIELRPPAVERWPEWLPHAIPKGTRNDMLTRLAGFLHQRPGDEKDILRGLLIANAERCVPPLAGKELRELERMARWMAKRPQCILGAAIGAINLAPFRAAASVYPFKGPTGTTDRHVLDAVFRIAEKEHRLSDLQLPARVVAPVALMMWETVRSSLYRLTVQGWLHLEQKARGEEGNRYRLAIPSQGNYEQQHPILLSPPKNHGTEWGVAAHKSEGLKSDGEGHDVG
jgi:hypothetical protein